jgi:tellurite methyltransferase
MTSEDRERWNRKYERLSDAAGPLTPAAATVSPVRPDDWLVSCHKTMRDSPLLPSRPRALDLACGLGHNAIWLATQGWDVDAVDISHAGLRRAQSAAATSNVKVRWIEADLDDWMPEGNCYDLVLVFRFLDRHTLPSLIAKALGPGGWLIYETFSASQFQRADNHLRNPDFGLQPGELTQVIFPTYDVVDQMTAELADRSVERLLARQRPAATNLPGTNCPEAVGCGT